jgi:hypothetical protein
MRASLVGTTVLAAVATAVVLPAGAVSASTDSEAPTITSVSAPTIVGLTSKGAVFDVTVKASDNIDIARVVVGVIDNAGRLKKPVGFTATLVKGMSWDGTYKARVTMPATVGIGQWNVSAFAEDNQGNRSTGVSEVRDSFLLKYATKIAKLNADPEPARKGKPLTVTGVLQQAIASGWGPYANKVVKIQFRKAGTSTWTGVGSAVSSSTGAFRFVTKASAAGEWRAVYKGDALKAKATSGIDKVALRK